MRRPAHPYQWEPPSLLLALLQVTSLCLSIRLYRRYCVQSPSLAA
jgi:hypothetical protein